MAKQSLVTFVSKVNNKHGNGKFDFSESVYQGLDKEITYKCNTCGQMVSQIAKKVLVHTGCPLCDQKKAKEQRKSGKYSKSKGNRYEQKIAKELRGLGFSGVVTSRSESKKIDNLKVDLIDTNQQLPFYAQLKCTSNTPSFFKIKSQCSLNDKPFVLFWNSQKISDGQINMHSEGEVVFVPKEFFYELIKNYKKC